jgi:hypothetical protein
MRTPSLAGGPVPTVPKGSGAPGLDFETWDSIIPSATSCREFHFPGAQWKQSAKCGKYSLFPIPCFLPPPPLYPQGV